MNISPGDEELVDLTQEVSDLIRKKLLAEVPVRFVAFDLLEESGVDIRKLPFSERRRRLETLLENQAPHSAIMLSPLVRAASWEELGRERRP